MTVQEVAALLRVSRDTVYRLAARGKAGRSLTLPVLLGGLKRWATQPARRRAIRLTGRAIRPSTGGTMTRVVLPLVLALATTCPALAQDAQDPVKIGVLAKRGAERCLEKWGPTAEYLTEQIPGRSFVIVPLGYEDVCPAVERGEVDFVLANPSMYVELEAEHGVNRLATFRNLHAGIAYTSYGGIIFRRADRDDIKCLRDLKGKTFVAADETSLGGWRAAWRELKEAGIDPYRDFADLRFDDTQDAVVYAVRDGLVDAGAVRSDTLERMAAEGKIRLEDFRAIQERGADILKLPLLRSTRRYPEWPFAKVAHTSQELAEKVALALLNMPADSPAAQAARCAGWTVPLNYEPVRECLKELRVGPYEDLGKITLDALVRQYWRWLVAAGVFLAVAAVTTLYVLRLNRGLNRSRLDLSRELSERKRAEETARMVQVQLIAQQQYETDRIQVELEKAREQLVSQTRLATIGQVSASIAHDLRNPLGSVRNAAYYLKRRLAGSEPKVAEHLDIIDQEVTAADRIISGLMDMTRTKPPIKQPVDLGQIVQEAFERTSLPEGIRCRAPLEPDPFIVHADASQLRQVVANIVNNAVQAMEGPGEIVVTARRSADYDTIIFEDEGPGLAPEVRERVFEPLFTTKAKGTGLGLTICRQIVERHGGTIDVVDQVGRGAAIRIRLPR
ncbi:MAG: PhnD/SsuA/transferrin family substrate-binding protein [Phycisphaerae bacterium]|nr:PhnD/SsuA/transferrin family substrate-binding protein [Phycisphaerae bacterium]